MAQKNRDYGAEGPGDAEQPPSEMPIARKKIIAALGSFSILSYRGVRFVVWTIWSVYQLALGAILVLLAVAIWFLNDYFAVSRTLALRKENPPTTAFIEAERARLMEEAGISGSKIKGESNPKPVKSSKPVGKSTPTPKIQWSWVPLNRIPRQIRDLALVAEDSKFYQHGGFDLEQIEYAVVANHQAGRKARGASTISQQVAKNLYLSGDKDYVRKLREAVITLLLEQSLEKDRILEIYLNTAQFGPGIFGVGEGAKLRFGKPLSELSQEECIALIGLLPSPVRWDPNKPTQAYIRHRQRVARNYGIYRGFKPGQEEQDDGEAMNKLAEQLEEQRWKGLRASDAVPEDFSQSENEAEPTSEETMPTVEEVEEPKVPPSSGNDESTEGLESEWPAEP